MKILICAATPVEALACERGVEKASDRRFEILQTGMGSENARRALRTRLYQGKPDLVVSSGFAGIWNGEIEVGSWVGATEVWSRTGDQFAKTPCSVQKSPAEGVLLVSVDIIGPMPSAVPAEFQSTQVGVDMESAGLAEICHESGIGFSVFRMVTDTPKDPLPEFVSTWTHAFQTPKWEDKFTFGAKGLMEVAQNFGVVKKFLVEGRQWALDLQQGWQENAKNF